MTSAILLLACLVLAGAVAVLAVSLRRLGSRLADLERGLVTDADAPVAPGLVTDAEAPAPAGLVAGASAPPATSKDEYVITRLGAEPDEAPVPTLEARLFADVVLRESVVKAASFAHGVRRGLAPENRNRIWFEMRREVKRARKQRKAEQREAVREWRARQRAAEQEPRAEESAA